MTIRDEQQQKKNRRLLSQLNVSYYDREEITAKERSLQSHRPWI